MVGVFVSDLWGVLFCSAGRRVALSASRYLGDAAYANRPFLRGSEPRVLVPYLLMALRGRHGRRDLLCSFILPTALHSPSTLGPRYERRRLSEAAGDEAKDIDIRIRR